MPRRLGWLRLFFAVVVVSLASTQSYAQTVTRLTLNQGNDIFPVWDPRGNSIAYLRPKTPMGSVYDAYIVNASGLGGEQALLTGADSDFGVAVGISWFGTSGVLAVEEAISGFEILRFDSAAAPFNRTTPNGSDGSTTLLLSINGGGGGGLSKISRDGTKALFRFSSNGSGGTVSLRFGAVSSMNQQLLSEFGNPLISVNAGADPYLLNGGALSPDGSLFAIPIPVGNSTTAHDIYIGSTGGGQTVNITNTAGTGDFNVFPDFSPDGTKIAFARRSSVPGAVFDLYTINIDGSGLTQLTNTLNFSENNPSWSPDGLQIAFNGTHVSGSESDAPALADGETANANIYAFTFPTPTPTATATSTAVPTVTPQPTPTSTPGIVSPRTKLEEPPIITFVSRTVTFIFEEFRAAQLGATARAAAKPKPKVSFKYELVVAKGSGRKREQIRKTSKKNSITLKNLKPGDYSAKYRVQIVSRTAGKRPVVKNTKFSPSQGFAVK